MRAILVRMVKGEVAEGLQRWRDTQKGELLLAVDAEKVPNCAPP